MILTNEQFEFLSLYEERFNEVLNQRVYRNLPDKTISKMAEIYHTATQTPQRGYSCMQCRFNFLKRLATLYTAEKNARTVASVAETVQKATKPRKATKETTKKKESE